MAKEQKKTTTAAERRALRKAKAERGKTAQPGTPLTPEQEQAKRDQEASVRIQDLLGPDAQGATDLADRFFKEGSLGRVDESRPAAVQDYLNRYREGLGGYTGAEQQGQLEQAQRGIDTQYQTSLGQLAKAQARGGVRGAAATRQQSNLDRSRMGEQQNLQQDLLVRNADEKQKRLGEYAQSLEGARSDELDRRKLNLDQLASERAGSAGTYFNALDLGQQRRGADRDYKLNKEMLDIAKRSARRSGGGGPDYSAYANSLGTLQQNTYG